jgi:hypothetical protein
VIGKGDVLDDHRGAGAAHGADRGEGALADFPVHVAGRRVGRKLHRLDGGDAGHRGMDGGNSLIYAVDRSRADFDQQRGGILAQFADDRWQAGLVFHRMHGRAVEQFDGRDWLRLEADDGFAGSADVREENQGTGLERIFDHRLVSDARDEAERAFGTDHQVGKDVDRVFVIDQRIQAVAGGVLDLELVADALGQLGVVARIAAQALQFAEQDGVAFREGIDAHWIFAIEHRAVGEHDAHAGQCAIAVLRRAAAHAGGVVGGDAADFAGVDRGRIGADFLAEGGEAAIDFAADDTWADLHFARIGVEFVGGEAFADQGEHAIGDRLAGEAGAGSAEGDRAVILPGCGQHRFQLVFRFDDGDDFGRQAVEAGIGAIGEQAQFIGDDLGFREVLLEGLD